MRRKHGEWVAVNERDGKPRTNEYLRIVFSLRERHNSAECEGSTLNGKEWRWEHGVRFNSDPRMSMKYMIHILF